MKDDLFKEKVLLVVDDEEDLREIISLEFEYFGATVLQAESVSKALDILSINAVDLIISDIRMPINTGIDLLNNVRMQNASKPAMILITGFADLDTSEAMSLGAEALVHKPFDMEELLNLANHFMIKFPQRYADKTQNIGSLHFYFDQNYEDELSKNVSFGRGGVRIVHKDQPVPLGSIRNIELHFKDKELSFQGMIRWKRLVNSEIVFGIEFTYIESKMISILEEFQNQRSYIPY